MKKTIKLLSALVLSAMLLVLCGCGGNFEAAEMDLDLTESPYKHINNGGLENKGDGLPYNIDAITGATLTVEGPAVTTSIPLSVREVENLKDGLVRGVYRDSKGAKTYEGLDLYHLLYEMAEGDNGIILTDTAYKAVLKDANRENVATLTVADIKAAHDSGRPAILAYGVGDTNGSIAAPFVFDGVDKNTHSLGYEAKLKNDDGCIKLVYDNGSYGDGSYKTFSNVAYVYLCEETAPGFKHTGENAGVFGASRYADYIITVRGSALGREFDLTTRQLEDLVTYDKNGNVVEGGIGYSDWYSLANNAYWYVNEYEGLQLYQFLQYLGMDDAETMGTKAARTTLVSFVASDGVPANETFSVDTLSYPEAFGYYKKNAQDNGDGTYVPTNADLVRLGYPILLSYGVNDYPYTVTKSDEAYVSGLSNSGGPFRVVFGKTQYNHPNGSNQVQYLADIIVGDDVLYNTHKYTDDPALKAAAESSIKISVVGANGSELINRSFSVGEIEDVIYGEEVSAQNKTAAKIKDIYTLGSCSSIYEGVNVKYLFMNVLGLPGMNGTATFTGAEGSVTVSLDRLFASGYNPSLCRDGMVSVLAFAKNGTPLVEDISSTGYQESAALKPFLPSDPAGYPVDNCGGPLMLIVPSSSSEADDTQFVGNVTEIRIELIPDSYAHLDGEAAAYAGSSVRFCGPGLEKERVFTVSELESMQTTAKTLDYSMLGKDGSLTEERFRGISVYELFKLVGINNNAGDVTVKCADGSEATYSLMLVKKNFPNFVNEDKDKPCAMIAYGRGDIDGDKLSGTPLMPKTGGPLMLVVPQETAESQNKSLCLKQVESVYVDANEVNTWSHSMSDVFSEFLDYEFTVSFKNDENEASRTYKVSELEAMEEIIVRDTYTVLDMGECEGVDLWKLIRNTAGDGIDLSSPVSITAYASDGYKNDLLANCYLTGFVDGIESETDSKRIILSYACKGYPLVDTEGHEGYTGMAKNCDGPLRIVVEGFQGGSLKCCNKVVVTLPGNDPIELK